MISSYVDPWPHDLKSCELTFELALGLTQILATQLLVKSTCVENNNQQFDFVIVSVKISINTSHSRSLLSLY